MLVDVAELVGRCKCGDSEAMAALYKAYSGKMKNTLRRIVGDDAVAADLLHDGFIVVLTSISSLRDASRLEPWMRRIMTNLALRYMRENGKSVPLEYASDVIDESGEDVNSAEIPFDMIMQMVEKLPDGYRQVFRLSVLDGMSHNDIAGILGIAPRSSSSQLLRARRKLQSMINEYRERIGMLLIFLTVVSSVIMNYEDDGKRQAELPQTKVRGSIVSHRTMNDNCRHAGTFRAVSLATEFYAEKTVDSVQNMFVPHLYDSLPGAECMAWLTVGNTFADTLCLPVPVTADSTMYADAGILKGKTETVENSEWLFGMNTVAEQASESLLPTVLSVVSNVVESSTRLEIETWQQLTEYLTYDVGDAMDPRERDALLRIAMINDGRIFTRRSYDKPRQIGLNFSKRLDDRWNMDFGLRLTRHTTNLLTGSSDTTNISERQRTVFIGVPLGVTYSFVRKGNWTFYGTAGIGLDIPLYGKFERDYRIDRVVSYRRTGSLHLPRWQWSVNCGAGVGYNITPYLQLYFSPKLTWYVPNSSLTTTQWNDKPLQLSLPVGLRIVFR